MDENLSKESILEKIIEKTGKPKSEIEALIEEKKKKFEGLLNDSGAAIMVARELEIGLEEKKDSQIKALEDGMKSVNIKAKIVHAFPPKEFEKNNKKGILQNILVSDESGEIRLTLWNEHAKAFQEQQISRGDEISLSNCFVSSFNEKKQLSLGYGGSMTLAKRKEKELPQKLSELLAGQNSVDVEGTLDRVFEEKTFNSNGKEGKLLAFTLKDDSMTMRAVAWNDAINEIKKAKQGEQVKIEGAYTKQSLNGVELNLGYSARVIIEPLVK